MNKLQKRSSQATHCEFQGVPKPNRTSSDHIVTLPSPSKMSSAIITGATKQEDDLVLEDPVLKNLGLSEHKLNPSSPLFDFQK
jgi:hypothetical protein